MKHNLKIAALGAAGLIFAAVLAALSLKLVSQPVGLYSEPVTAGDRLAAPHRQVTTATGATDGPEGDDDSHDDSTDDEHGDDGEHPSPEAHDESGDD